MFKLGCTLPNLANICLHKSTNYKFDPFCESDKCLCEKIREDLTGGPSIVFTRKAVFDETFPLTSARVMFNHRQPSLCPVDLPLNNFLTENCS